MLCCQEVSTVRLVDYLRSPGHCAQLLALQGSCLDAAPQESKGPHQRQHLYYGAFAWTQKPAHAVSATSARCIPTRSPPPNPLLHVWQQLELVCMFQPASVCRVSMATLKQAAWKISDTQCFVAKQMTMTSSDITGMRAWLFLCLLQEHAPSLADLN